MGELTQLAQTRILNALIGGGAGGQTFVSQTSLRSGFVPADMQSAQDGNWSAFGTWSKCIVIFFKAAGTAGDDPLISMQQATSSGGAGAKDLEFTDLWLKEGTLSAIANFTHITQAAAASYQMDGTSAESEALLVLQFDKADLDQGGGFDYLRFRVADVGGNQQLGCALYLFCDDFAAGILNVDDLEIGLYSAPLPTIPATVIGDVTEPVFTGYTRKTFTSWLMGTRGDGNKFIASPSVQWQATALPSGAQPVFGAFLYNTATAELVDFWPFPSMLNIDHVGQILECSPEFGLNDQLPVDLIPSTS